MHAQPYHPDYEADDTYVAKGHALRGVRARSHGLLQGQLRVLDGLPSELAQGIFADAGVYRVVMRLSATANDMLDGSGSGNGCQPRGMAVKVIGVAGARLADSTSDRTQDFVLGAGGHPYAHPLGASYFSQAPILYGSYMAKVCVVPVSQLAGLKDVRLLAGGRPDAMRDAVVDYFSAHCAEWELRVQLCTNIATMPLEDPSVEWPQEQSPYVTVARISMPVQPAWSQALSHAVDEGMAFNPWHCVAAHRPLGGVMHAHKAA